jgi:trehalose 6-phosphate phosphatase
MARELRPPVPIDKGTAVHALLERTSSAQRACFAGDDHGDLAAFDALAHLREEGRIRTAVRIGVNSAEAPARLAEAVDLLVDGPPGLAALLDDIATALS